MRCGSPSRRRPLPAVSSRSRGGRSSGRRAKPRPEAVADEYSTLFGGVGKPEVYLFASHYLSGFLNDKALARLRSDLAALGLARDEAMPETEDHIAYLCEVMRYLIAGDEVSVSESHASARVLRGAPAAMGERAVRRDRCSSESELLSDARRLYPSVRQRRGTGVRHVGVGFFKVRHSERDSETCTKLSAGFPSLHWYGARITFQPRIRNAPRRQGDRR